MARTKSVKDTTANLGFEAKLWLAADKLRNNMDAAEYKHVVLGLIFLKYISDSFAENVFWVLKEARWSELRANAKRPTIGKIVDVDDAMVSLERDNIRLKGVLPKDYARPAHDKHRLGELIDLIGTIGLGDAANRAQDILGRTGSQERHHRLDTSGKHPRPDQGTGEADPQQVRVSARLAGQSHANRPETGGIALGNVVNLNCVKTKRCFKMKTKSYFSVAFLILPFLTIPVLNISLSAAKAPAVAANRTDTGQKEEEDKLFPYPIPLDLPIPKNSERLGRSFQFQTLSYTFGCTQSSSDVITFYRDQLPKLGWKTTVTSASENKFGPIQVLSGKKEEEGLRKSCELTIGPVTPGTTKGGESRVSNPPFQSYVNIRYSDPALVAKPVN